MTFLNNRSRLLSTPATNAPNTIAKMNTAKVRRQVSRRLGQITCRSSRQELIKYLGTSQRNGRSSGRSELSRVGFDNPVVEPEIFLRLGLFSVLMPAASVCELLTGGLRTRIFLSATNLSSLAAKIHWNFGGLNQKPTLGLSRSTCVNSNRLHIRWQGVGYIGCTRALWARIAFCFSFAFGVILSRALQKAGLWFKCWVWTNSCRIT